MNLKRVLASSCRQRLLEELAQVKDLHVNALVRQMNSTYTDVARNLMILQKEGLIVEKHVGRQRRIGLNRENNKIKLLLQVLKTLENEENKQQLI